MTDQIRDLSLSEQVKTCLSQYFSDLDGDLPENLYERVVHEFEKPLLELTLRYVKNNQVKAAQALNLNRGTLRKKLTFYGIQSSATDDLADNNQ